jgi:hypothetical protein
MDNEDDSWDQVDWDQKIDDAKPEPKPEKEKSQKNVNVSNSSSFNFGGDDDENYFEANQQRRLQQREIAMSRENTPRVGGFRVKKKEETPFPFAELHRIRSLGEKDFSKLIFETYGNFNKLIETHKQNLSDESLVELLKIDVALLEVPFIHHNNLLLEKLSTIKWFWMQINILIEKFFKGKCNDPKYLLLVDMKGMFENLESLLFRLVASKSMCNKMDEVLMMLLKTIGTYIESEHLNMKRFHEVLEMLKGLSSDVHLFEVRLLNCSYTRF